MYDPTTGRWLTEDPSGFDASDANLYRYVANDPTNAIDPSGLFEITKTNIRTTGKIADLDKEAVDGTPYSDVVKDLLSKQKRMDKNTHMEVPANLEKLGAYKYFSAAFKIGDTELSAKSFVGVNYLLFIEWDIKPSDAKEKIQGSVIGKEYQTRTVGDKKGDETLVPTDLSITASGSVKLFKLKKPTKEGATYRIIYGDTPGVDDLVFLKEGKRTPLPLHFTISDKSYYEILSPTSGIPLLEPVAKSKVKFNFIADWKPNTMTFYLNKERLASVEVK